MTDQPITLNFISWSQARDAGLKRYFTGKPCKYGHICERSTCDGHCLICKKRIALLWRKATPERRAQRNKKRRELRIASPEKRIKLNRNRHIKESSTPERRFIKNLRNKLNMALVGNSKPGRTMDIIGCSIEQLIEYLKKQMENTSMTFDNRSTFHVDHILPISSFDHSNPDQVRACWHWTNLRPLPPIDNILKGNKI